MALCAVMFAMSRRGGAPWRAAVCVLCRMCGAMEPIAWWLVGGGVAWGCEVVWGGVVWGVGGGVVCGGVSWVWGVWEVCLGGWRVWCGCVCDGLVEARGFGLNVFWKYFVSAIAIANANERVNTNANASANESVNANASVHANAS